MLAICSDLDETPNSDVYYELMRFLNTTDNTSMGPGVGLEVGNTIYFDMPPGQFAYWSTDDRGRAMARALIQSGHIDCLHSFGDLATTRAHAGRALDELEKHNCQLKVWVDHAIASTNFGSDIMRGHGDEAGHPAYHADLTTQYGVRYVWRGRVTSVIGQNQPVSLRGVWQMRAPVASARTVAKEGAKQVLAQCGSPKYRLHALNRISVQAALRDGTPCQEFLRCNPHPTGVSCGATGDGIADVLTPEFMDRLVAREGACVLYTHLGKLRNRRCFSPPAIAAFRKLKEYQDAGKILVVTTRRLLDYCHAHQTVSWTVRTEGKPIIHLQASGTDWSASQLEGLTFCIEGSVNNVSVLFGPSSSPMRVNANGQEQKLCISIDRTKLHFPRVLQ